ncbi:tetratricopeptide repeat protein [Actinomadura hibisca]|uniref:tetratricopeptide repeat protein n=1 Tax=Actinomadura hibisca TaxID=68565 RepID=UPI000829B1C6|nr:tetratricopeptide repeat protein [Actinomadura hibisca]
MTEAHRHEGVTDPRLEAEGELGMARLALDDGELRHAADHVARALVHAPALPEAHELLALLAARPDGGPELYPLEQPVFLGTVVARAHVLAGRGEYGEAVGLLVSAQCHEPRGAWADVPWMHDPSAAARLDPDDLAMRVVRLVTGLNDPVPEDERPPLLPYAALLRAAVAAHPGHAGLLWTGSMLLRRIADPAEAVEFAARAEAVEPSFNAAMALGYAHRAARQWDLAEQAWRRALAFDPGNTALLTDIGELMASAGRPDEAMPWLERALELDPDDPSAFPTACGMRFDRDGDPAHLAALADHLRARPDNAHADRVLTNVSQRHYWLGHVPRPSEAVVNVLRQMLAEGGGTGGAALTLSAPEPPSALLAFDRALPGSTVDITGVPEPDPRRTVPEVFAEGPVRTVRHRVWEYDGVTAHPAVPPPSPEALRAVQAMAGHRWRHLPGAYDDAVRLAETDLDDLLGVLVHPPAQPEPDPATLPEWIRSAQAWACLGIAHHRPDEPWEGSRRRAVLVDLAYGPEDWTGEAALLALVAVAWTHPEARADVAALVSWRFLAALRAGRDRAVPVLDSLALLVRVTPDVHPDMRGLAAEVLEEPAG